MAWGVWHGAFLVSERISTGPFLARLPTAGRWAYTMVVVMAGWVLFRSQDLAAATVMYKGLIGRNGVATMNFDVHSALPPSVVVALLAGCAFAVLPRWVKLSNFRGPVAAVADGAWTFGLLALTMTSVASGTYSPFLYFRF